MKTQMEIVLEGIQKLEKLSPTEFEKTLIDAGAYTISDVTYTILQNQGELLSSNQSLHLWEEVYLYESKVYQVMGCFNDSDYIEITQKG